MAATTIREGALIVRGSDVLTDAWETTRVAEIRQQLETQRDRIVGRKKKPENIQKAINEFIDSYPHRAKQSRDLASLTSFIFGDSRSKYVQDSIDEVQRYRNKIAGSVGQLVVIKGLEDVPMFGFLGFMQPRSYCEPSTRSIKPNDDNQEPYFITQKISDRIETSLRIPFGIYRPSEMPNNSRLDDRNHGLDSNLSMSGHMFRGNPLDLPIYRTEVDDDVDLTFVKGLGAFAFGGYCGADRAPQVHTGEKAMGILESAAADNPYLQDKILRFQRDSARQLFMRRGTI